MASKVLLKKSSVAAKAPVAGDLDYGELAINYTDGKIYYKKADNTIDYFASGAASAPVTSVGGFIGAVSAANLMTAIQTVDGTGSGLDADTLDGNHASAFYLASNPSGYTSNIGTVTSVGATAPVVSSGGTAPTISMAAATASVNGYMTSTYASKLDGIAAGATNVTNTNQLTNGAGYITSTGSISGNATTATTATYLSTTQQTNTITGKQASMAMSQDGGATVGSFVCKATGTGDANLAGMTFWNDAYAIKMGIRADGYFGLGGWSRAAWSWYSAPDGSMVAAGNVTAYSDEKLKKNWRDLPTNYIEQLASVKYGIYDRIDEDLTQVGVSAQSLQKVLPDAVMMGLEDTLTVNYGGAAMVSAVALAERVVQQDKRIAELERLIAKIIGD